MVLDLIEKESFHLVVEDLVIILGKILSSSVYTNNKTRIILVLGEDFIQGIDGTAIYADKMYSINFTKDNKKFCLSLHYNGADSY